MAVVGIAFLFSRPEIEPKVPAPPARMAKNRPSGERAMIVLQRPALERMGTDRRDACWVRRGRDGWRH